MGTMRRHSLLDMLTLWGGISMFMLVVLYIVGKRSLYFVPGFAKNLVSAPFRTRYPPPPQIVNVAVASSTALVIVCSGHECQPALMLVCCPLLPFFLSCFS